MAMDAAEIEALIKAALPDARVTIEDLAGDGDHYAPPSSPPPSRASRA
jgi:acid stress-induced BolA-like protein IbaG/YrbA